MAPKKKPRIEEAAAADDEQAAAEGAGEEDQAMTAAVEEEVAPEEEVETEVDAVADKRPKLKESVCFLTEDTTATVVASTVGSMLLSMKDSTLQYFLAGARCNVGVKSGRYAFEVSIVEALNPADPPQSKVQTSVPKSLLRVGFSTIGSDLIIGDGADSVCFDETGFFMYNESEDSRPVKAEKIFNAGASIVLVLNLDEKSKNCNTVSLFVDGIRTSQPQALPEALKGKVLYPSVTFKNATVHYNFADCLSSPLPFKCRMLEDAAAVDVVVAKGTSEDPEVLFPIFMPDKGTHDWCDWFLKENPRRYIESSDRAILDWASRSGLKSNKIANKNSSNDRPTMGFGVPALDDGGNPSNNSAKEALLSLAPIQRRSYLVMEVKGNLVKEDRIAALKRWKSVPYKKVAQVMIGTPEEGFKKSVHAVMLAEKQAKLDKEFESKKVQRAAAKMQREKAQSILRAAKKAADMIKEEESNKRKAEEQEGDGDDAKNETKQEEVKDEEGSQDEKMEEEEEEKAPVATLTLVEKQVNFRKLLLSDIGAQVLGNFFNKFSLPDESEGFDEIRFTWAPKVECEDHLRRWVVERKLNTRIEDLQPSSYFKEKWGEWQKDLQTWHTKHNDFKDPQKRSAAEAGATAKAYCKAPPAQPLEDKKAEEDAKKVLEDDKEPTMTLEEELDKEDTDLFAVNDVGNPDGDGTPLFANFAFEDWALLSLRFEIHLLAHAFVHDANDSERTGIHPDHMAFYYNRYYKKGLNPKNYGVETVEELLELVKDTAMADARNKMVESMVTDDLESNDIFVKLTEENRRDRQRRIDTGDESVKLKFTRPAAGPGAAGMSAVAPQAGRPPVILQSGARPVGNQGQLGIKPKLGGMTVPPAFAKMGMQTPQWGQQGAFNTPVRPQWGGARPGVNPMTQRANMMQGAWNQNFGNMWGQNWRG